MFGDDGEPVVQPARKDRRARYGKPAQNAQPEEPSGQLRDEPRPAGRLVAPDEGAHPDEEGTAVAGEAGPDSGGYAAEEEAMRVEPE